LPTHESSAPEKAAVLATCPPPRAAAETRWDRDRRARGCRGVGDAPSPACRVGLCRRPQSQSVGHHPWDNARRERVAAGIWLAGARQRRRGGWQKPRGTVTCCREARCLARSPLAPRRGLPTPAGAPAASTLGFAARSHHAETHRW